MDDFRNILLPRTRFAGDQDRQVGRSELDGRLQRQVERRVVADDVKFIF